MKVFRKMFAFAVTVSAIAMATSAFAATAEYDSTNVLVTVDDTAAFTETAQMTVAVVPTNFGETDAEIYYIDQDAAATIKDNLVNGLAVKEELVNPAENYEVRVAGTNMEMQTIEFAEVQTTNIENVSIVGAGTAVKAVGIKGEFTYNGGATSVVLTLKDTVNKINGEDAIGYVTWDLGSIASTNTPLVFGLEIQSATEMDMTGIEYVGFTAQ